MITITEQPSECINDIKCPRICMETDAYLQLESTWGVMGFTLPGINASPGDTMAISVNGVVDVFEFTNLIPLPPNRIKIGATRDITVDNIRDVLLSHYLMSFFTEVGTGMVLGANYVYINWDTSDIIELIFSDPNNIALYGFLTPPIQYQPAIVSQGYQMTATLVKGNNLLYTTSDIFLTLDQKGCVNLQSFLKSHLKSTLPTFGTAYTLLDDLTETFQLWLNERNALGQIWRTGTGDIKVIRSYKPVECGTCINEYDQFGNTLGIQTYEFCSKDFVWLYFLRESAATGDFSIRFSTIFGTIATIAVPSSSATDVIAVNVSMDYLVSAGIFNPTSMTGLFVQIDCGNGYNTVAGFRYNDVHIPGADYQDGSCCGTEQLLFLTKRGVFESIRLGAVSNTIKTKKYLYAANKGCESENRVYGVDISENFEFASKVIGGRDTEIQMIKDFQSSPEIYWIIEGEPVRLSDEGGTLKIKLNRGNEFKIDLDASIIEKY